MAATTIDEITEQAIEEAFAKITGIQTLPTFDEATTLISLFGDGYPTKPVQKPLSRFFSRSHVYNIFTVEFVDALAEAIKALNDRPIVEICAGNGKLAYHLRRRGIDIIATDDYSWAIDTDTRLVEPLPHDQALMKYQPRIVIGSWIPGEHICLDVLNFPSVRHFIDIGGFVEATKDRQVMPDRKGWKATNLENASRFTVNRTFNEQPYYLEVSLYQRE